MTSRRLAIASILGFFFVALWSGVVSAAPLDISPSSLNIVLDRPQSFTIRTPAPATVNATSSNPDVCLVAPASASSAGFSSPPSPQAPALFSVFPISSGSCTIAFKDSLGNSASASVLVGLSSAPSVLNCPLLGESGVGGVLCTYVADFPGPYAVHAGPPTVCSVSATFAQSPLSGVITVGASAVENALQLSDPCTVEFVESTTGTSFFSTLSFTSSAMITCPTVVAAGTSAFCTFGDHSNLSGIVAITASSASGSCSIVGQNTVAAPVPASGRVTVSDSVGETCLITFKEPNGSVTTATVAFRPSSPAK